MAKKPHQQHQQPANEPMTDVATDETETQETAGDTLPEDDAPPPQAPPSPAPARVGTQARVVAQERLVKVTPRVNRESFRCNGKYWHAVAGRDMHVPPGVAEHMRNIGIL